MHHSGVDANNITSRDELTADSQARWGYSSSQSYVQDPIDSVIGIGCLLTELCARPDTKSFFDTCAEIEKLNSLLIRRRHTE